MKVLKVLCQGEVLILHPSGAAFWENKKMLLIADVHIGKVSHFRKHGSAVPQQSVRYNFDQLNEVVTYFQPHTICFLGDLFHSVLNNEWLLFQNWIHDLQCRVILIAGNHDIIDESMYKALGVEVKNELVIGSFFLTHYPEYRDDFFNFSGHIHPGVELRGLGKQILKVSCFVKKKQQFIFPAFGGFTGKYIIKPSILDEVYVITPDEVIHMKN